MWKLCFSFWTSRAFISSKVVLGEILSSISIPISAATFSVVSVLLNSVSAVRTISGIADIVSSVVVLARHFFTFCASLLRVERFYALKSDVWTNFEGKKKKKEKKFAKHIMIPTEGRYAHYAVDMHVYYKNHLLILLPTIEHFGAPHSYPFVYDPSSAIS